MLLTDRAVLPASPVHEPIGVWFSSALSTWLPIHQHPGLELNLLMSGSVAYRLEHEVEHLSVTAGQCVILPPGVRHELVSASADMTMWVIELCHRTKTKLEMTPRVFSPDAHFRHQVVSTARRLWLRPTTQVRTALEKQLLHDIDRLKDGKNHRRPTLHKAVLRAMGVCEGLGCNDLDVEGIAEESKLSASRLAHLFAEQIGISPLQYRNFARVQRLIQTYNGDERDLSGSASHAGFGSYAQFHRVFRQVCDCSPAAHFEWIQNSPRVNASRTIGNAHSTHVS